MRWTSILTTLDDADDSRARLDLSCRLAQVFGARLIGVAGEPATPPAIADGFMGGVSAETLTLFRDAAQGAVAAHQTRFEAAGRASGVETLWRGRTGFPAEIVKTEARLADMIVMGRRSPLCDVRAADPGEVLLGAGRPVLVVPPRPSRDPWGHPAIVAWRDTGECRRAVAAAVPLLARAASVQVTAVINDVYDDAQDGPSAVCDWLARHDVAATAVVRPTLQEPGDEILDLAVETQAGLIVAGGYGHARLREWVMGGVTRTLLTQGDACVLMAH